MDQMARDIEPIFKPREREVERMMIHGNSRSEFWSRILVKYADLRSFTPTAG
jgi:hypothetical protein